jgi:hypothetical protein
MEPGSWAPRPAHDEPGCDVKTGAIAFGCLTFVFSFIALLAAISRWQLFDTAPPGTREQVLRNWVIPCTGALYAAFASRARWRHTQGPGWPWRASALRGIVVFVLLLATCHQRGEAATSVSLHDMPRW